MDKAVVAGLLRTALSGLKDDEEASTSASTSASTTSTEFRRPSTSRAREVASASVHGRDWFCNHLREATPSQLKYGHDYKSYITWWSNRTVSLLQDGEEYLCIEDCPDMDVREIIQEMILERIAWPSLSDSESDEEFELGQKCSVTGYLREYIQEATSNELCDLLKG
ncbi:hypothetical protein SKAU_G00095020 [Synaphobranchus kaupii]|uniref:Uncharacterized protein n=1 Tax=Synaphobranchus kaupii TaxID=118154 RepID=A0A9Q1FX55_SYNKA|nr:hypothetical protein SKAU_G00095020 [Synaphobranchus kaupii]